MKKKQIQNYAMTKLNANIKRIKKYKIYIDLILPFMPFTENTYTFDIIYKLRCVSM